MLMENIDLRNERKKNAFSGSFRVYWITSLQVIPERKYLLYDMYVNNMEIFLVYVITKTKICLIKTKQRFDFGHFTQNLKQFLQLTAIYYLYN